MTVFIHIGTSKTGTTTIQHTMLRNADRLRREHSINYPSIAVNHWPIVLPYVKEREFRPLENHLRRNLGTKDQFWRMARRLARDLRRNANRYKTHVISSEQLLIADREAIAGLRGLFAGLGLETKIVVYIRHPAERLSSLVSQQIRQGDADLKSFAIRDAITPALRTYTDVFGKDNIIVRRFGSRYFTNGDLMDDFTSIIHQTPLEGLNPERLNESISVPAVMLAERLFGVAPLVSGLRGRDEYLHQIAGPKFRAPRAMVEQAVEAHRDGMEYLATEFGIRFDDVDLSAFPETIPWEFPEEAVASVAAILNEQSLTIGRLKAAAKRRRWDRRVKYAVRKFLGLG